MIPEEDTGDVNKDVSLHELSETNPVATEENDISVLEESAIEAPAPDLTTGAPEAGSECLSYFSLPFFLFFCVTIGLNENLQRCVHNTKKALFSLSW